VWHTQAARPRYFSLVQIPADEVKPWLAGFDRRVKLVDGQLLLLFARTGRLLEQYRTTLHCLVPAREEIANRSEFRAASFVGWNPWRNQVTDSATVSHNFGALYVPARTVVNGANTGSNGGRTSPVLWGVGGQDIEQPLKSEAQMGWSPTHRRGIYLLNATRLVDIRFGGWFPHTRTDHITRAPAIDGHHPGCVERRREFAPVGQFDGKLSLARLHDRYLLYARANLKLDGGGRFVQVARSRGDSPASGWLPWELITIEGYQPDGAGNVYLATVKPNPFDADMLLGLFAVNLGQNKGAADVPHGKPRHIVPRKSNKFVARRDRVVGPYSGHNSGNTDGRAFVALALSCNGRDWSALQEISPTVGSQGRTYDQPVDGLLTVGGTVSVLIHRDVYEIAPDAREQSRIVRRELQSGAMRHLSEQVKIKLPGCNPYSSFDS